jgi:hypothetical protein
MVTAVSTVPVHDASRKSDAQRCLKQSPIVTTACLGKKLLDGSASRTDQCTPRLTTGLCPNQIALQAPAPPPHASVECKACINAGTALLSLCTASSRVGSRVRLSAGLGKLTGFPRPRNDSQQVVLRAALVCSEALLFMISANGCDYFKASLPTPPRAAFAAGVPRCYLERGKYTLVFHHLA